MKNYKAKLTGAIVLFMIIMLVPMIVLAVTNDKVQIISNTDEQGNTEYIVYIQELMQTNFASAVSNSASTPEQDLTFVTSQDGERNYVAQIDATDVTGESTYLYVKYDGQESTEVIELDLSNALDKTEMEYVENTTKRIGTKTVRDLVDINEEEIDGVRTTTTVGGLQITDTDNASYEYELTKVVEGTSYSRLVELAEELNSENYDQKDMYSKIQLTSEFYTLYNQLVNEATWTDVTNNEIRQPNDAEAGDEYVVLIRKTAEDGTVTTDAKLMTSYIDNDEIREDIPETRTVRETTKLPITGDSIVLFVALAVVVIALIIVFARMKKLNKKEDK